MNLINSKILSLLFTLISCCACFSILAAEASNTSVSSEATEVTIDQSALIESQEILVTINELSQQSADLKAMAAEIPAFDRLLFITLVINIENEIRAELDRLVTLQQKIDQGTPQAERLLAKLKSLTIAQETIFKNEIEVLKKLMGKMKSQDSPNSSTDLTIERTKHTIFDLLAAWIKNIEHQKTLGMDTAASAKRLGQIVQFVAVAQTGRIQIAIDTIKELNGMLADADVDEQKQIKKQLSQLEWRKDTAARNLERMMVIMKKLGMDTTKFGQVLVVATGELLHSSVETKVIVGLFKRMLDKSTLWLQDNLPLIIFRIFSFLLIILIFRIIAAIFRGIVNKATASAKFDSSQLLRNFLGSIAHKTVMIIGLIVALSQLGIEVGPLLAGMGIMGFVVGFALQDTLSNFASGLMILIYRPFDISNFVDVAGGITGEVKHMNLVSTTILTIDNKRLIIPNSKIWGDIITNVTAERVRRVDLVFGIGYGDSISDAEKVLQEIVAHHELVLDSPKTVIKLHTLGESSVDFIVRPWVKTKDYWDVYWDITRQVKERFDAEGISIPYPQRDVHVFQQAISNQV